MQVNCLRPPDPLERQSAARPAAAAAAGRVAPPPPTRQALPAPVGAQPLPTYPQPGSRKQARPAIVWTPASSVLYPLDRQDNVVV